MSVKKRREKMPVAQRAKQFAPFKAVGGLDEALREREERHRRQFEKIERVPWEEDGVTGNTGDSNEAE